MMGNLRWLYAGYVMGLVLGGVWVAPPLQAACTGCTAFAPGVNWGTVTIDNLKEASGIAASRRNPGVFWAHNDGTRQNVYAVDANGARLATFNLNTTVDDVEDVAVGPGPVAGMSYLYFGDIGGSNEKNNIRAQVKILRLPEPLADLAWARAPHSTNLAGVETFTLVYPDASHDAETLMVDPLTADLFVITKQTNAARVYRVNLGGATNHATLDLEFVRELAFVSASGGDISADGAQIIVRREDFAMLWQRCDGETVETALGRDGLSVPILGPPSEPNGEGIGFLADGSGYVTISEGTNPTLHFFGAQCPSPPGFVLPITDASEFAGGMAVFQAIVVGYPTPTYSWTFCGSPLDGQTNSTLTLTNLVLTNAGDYLLTASNASGAATSRAALAVRPKPDLRITEVQSAEAASPGVPTSDWWELTSFESQPVNLTGWRFNDADGGLTDAFVIGTPVILGSGETLVFVEGLSATQFQNWWGATNLPAGLQIIPYSGGGLSLGGSGDRVRLWNATTTDTNDTVVQVSFGTAQAGVSFNYDPVTGVFGGVSVLGINGVIRAAATSDLGSPGRILAPLVQPVLGISRSESQVRITFEAAVGRRYWLEARGDIAADTWESTGDTFTGTNSMRTYFEQVIRSDLRFFRVRAE